MVYESGLNYNTMIYGSCYYSFLVFRFFSGIFFSISIAVTCTYNLFIEVAFRLSMYVHVLDFHYNVKR